MFYYGVKLITGHKAIVNDWQKCQEVIRLEPTDARYKKFVFYGEALAFIEDEEPKEDDMLFLKCIPEQPEFEECFNKHKRSTLAYVYGNYAINVGAWSYGVILFLNKSKDYRYFMGAGTNHIKSMKLAGDVYGTCKAIQESIQAGYPHITVCYQYEGIEKWARGTFKKTKSELGKAYAEYIQKCTNRIDIDFKKIYFTDDNAILQKAYKLSREALGLR